MMRKEEVFINSFQREGPNRNFNKYKTFQTFIYGSPAGEQNMLFYMNIIYILHEYAFD
jgi:hypothetical protein